MRSSGENGQSQLTYVVRMRETKEFVGVYAATRPEDLFWLIDECTDPGACEMARLSNFGIYVSNVAPRVPADLDAFDDDEGPEFLAGAQFTQHAWGDLTGSRRLNWRRVALGEWVDRDGAKVVTRDDGDKVFTLAAGEVFRLIRKQPGYQRVTGPEIRRAIRATRGESPVSARYWWYALAATVVPRDRDHKFHWSYGGVAAVCEHLPFRCPACGSYQNPPFEKSKNGRHDNATWRTLITSGGVLICKGCAADLPRQVGKKKLDPLLALIRQIKKETANV